MVAVAMGQEIAFLLQGQDGMIFQAPIHCLCWIKGVERKGGRKTP